MFLQVQLYSRRLPSNYFKTECKMPLTTGFFSVSLINPLFYVINGNCFYLYNSNAIGYILTIEVRDPETTTFTGSYASLRHSCTVMQCGMFKEVTSILSVLCSFWKTLLGV